LYNLVVTIILGINTYLGGKQMFKNIKKRLKDQRGVTLVELLAVIVILGIISAIAVPNITGLIDRTKTDAHEANAQQMADSARLSVLTNNDDVSSGKTYKLSDLISGGYLENISDPSGVGYDTTNSTVTVTKAAGTGVYTYTVTLKAKNNGTQYFNGNPFADRAANLPSS
jgi:type IV pilus assembly protein PilA